MIDKVERQPRDVSRGEAWRRSACRRACDRPLFGLHGARRRSTRSSTRFGDRADDCARCIVEFRRYFDVSRRDWTSLDWVTIDLSIVRGLAYYTGIVFELFDAKGELRAICGGGRYDNLLQVARRRGSAGARIRHGRRRARRTAARSRGLLPSSAIGPQVWVAARISRPSMATCGAQRRRSARQGVSVEYALARSALRKQMKAAKSAGAAHAAVERWPARAPAHVERATAASPQQLDEDADSSQFGLEIGGDPTSHSSRPSNG